jgi:hypothetical protein
MTDHEPPYDDEEMHRALMAELGKPDAPLDRITQTAREIIERHRSMGGDGAGGFLDCRWCGHNHPCPDRVAAERILADATQLAIKFAGLEAERDSLRAERVDLNELLRDALRRFEWNESQGSPRYVREPEALLSEEPQHD